MGSDSVRPQDESASVVAALGDRVREAIDDGGGWLSFERLMAMALYEPGLGYYAAGRQVFGAMPQSGSDFVTAPELTPLFGRALAAPLAQALRETGCDTVVEFGAGAGALAEQLLDALGPAVRRYAIVDLSGALRARQQERLQRFGARVEWWDALPDRLVAVVVGNEVLDAMPVQLLHFDGARWYERGVTWVQGRLHWADRPTDARPPVDGPFLPGTVTEVHRQAEAFVATLGRTLERGAAFFLDYGFPEAEYYHPQRHGGTLMCHRGHIADTDPLADLGAKDITAHVNFTGIAVAAQQAGLAVLGYTSQGRFLINSGLVELMADADLKDRVAAQRLLHEHEMGELFKVIGLGAGGRFFDALGFAEGDRTHRL
ncbi:class I SAM-dependent methyltransferase [Aquabacterium sp. J223]|uniref:class I SAM-dependent methyltransferase n=1 Tax=Aquabacterium sp. J223 TaxID=2898431 RepID=UPI0021ADCF40|nr:SAM-dependent methyltransferase [Aquabacterium sp. J223]UUX96444.1 SAM-dependent methyltransferase [Aquabacterium sp. J223]